MQRRGLKQALDHIQHIGRVASHAEAWIETAQKILMQMVAFVASHAEAWIETNQTENLCTD